jgi:hypothetical protein
MASPQTQRPHGWRVTQAAGLLLLALLFAIVERGALENLFPDSPFYAGDNTHGFYLALGSFCALMSAGTALGAMFVLNSSRALRLRWLLLTPILLPASWFPFDAVFGDPGYAINVVLGSSLMVAGAALGRYLLRPRT